MESQLPVWETPEFDEVVRLDPKGRFEVERDRVRARYGHSLELEEKPHPGMPPATLCMPPLIELPLAPEIDWLIGVPPTDRRGKPTGTLRVA